MPNMLGVSSGSHKNMGEGSGSWATGGGQGAENQAEYFGPCLLHLACQDFFGLPLSVFLLTLDWSLLVLHAAALLLGYTPGVSC